MVITVKYLAHMLETLCNTAEQMKLGGTFCRPDNYSTQTRY